jgi:hypothetical protein
MRFEITSQESLSFISFYVGIKLFAGNSATDADEAQAFYRDHINPSMIEIFSNSWGPSDNGYTIRGPGRLAAEAFKHGIQKASLFN